jgi:hypothetical protein
MRVSVEMGVEEEEKRPVKCPIENPMAAKQVADAICTKRALSSYDCLRLNGEGRAGHSGSGEERRERREQRALGRHEPNCHYR